MQPRPVNPKIFAPLQELLAGRAISIKTGPDGEPVLDEYGEPIYVRNERTAAWLAGEA
jgi:hypothetical protein